jgi:PAS domain-containing protein
LFGVVALLAAMLVENLQWAFALWATAGGALSASALVMGAAMLRRGRMRATLRAALRVMEHDPTPCFCSDGAGAIVAVNAAAARRFGEPLGQPMSRAILGMLPNAAAVVFRTETALERQPMTHETVLTTRGPVRLTAHRLAGGVFWRIDDQGGAAPHSGDGIALPMMVVSQSDTILSMNPAMRDVLGRRPTALADVFTQAPVIAGRRTILSGASGEIAVVPVIVPSRDGRREVYVVPGLADPPAASVAARAFESLPVAMLAAWVMIYVILAWLFGSYLQPFAVMLAIPFSLIGVVWGHWLLGFDLTFLSLIGVVALAGVVVNNSLILVEFLNRNRRAGMPLQEALVDAGRRRLRPILLTTATTVLGLTPLMLEPSFQARFLVPMAISITWGLMSSTILTLLVLPAILVIVDDITGAFHWLWFGRLRREQESR